MTALVLVAWQTRHLLHCCPSAPTFCDSHACASAALEKKYFRRGAWVGGPANICGNVRQLAVWSRL
jgi:hypothetical protein